MTGTDGLSWVDIFVLIVLGISALLSLFRGLVREVLSLVGWIVAGWCAFKFSGPVGELFGNAITMPSMRTAVAFVGILIGVLLVFGILNFLLGKLIDSTGLGATDRMLGMVFGAVRGAAIVTVLVMFAGLTPLPKDPWWRQSMFLPHFEALAKLAIDWLPPEFRKHFDYDPGRLETYQPPTPS